MQTPELLSRVEEMKRDWDWRARENAKWFINLSKLHQTDDEFFETGRREFVETILSDPVFTAGRPLCELRILEIGCGIGRMTVHLADHFGEVHAVDVSREMIALAEAHLSGMPRVFLHETNGLDFHELQSNYFDRAFSVYVFQHIPDVEVIRANIRDAIRTLRPGGLLKFQVNSSSDAEFHSTPKDTWTGVSFSESEIRRVADDSNAQLVSLQGSGTQFCWATLRKRVSNTSNDDADLQIEYFACTSEPGRREIPVSGPTSSLSFILSGLAPDRIDANRVIAEIADRSILARYAGSVTAAFAKRLQAIGMQDISSLAQADFSVPTGVSVGEHQCRVRDRRGELSHPIDVTFCLAEPTPPRIYYASNCVDGGVDIHCRGPKSRFRVFVLDLDEGAGRGSVDLFLDDVRLEIEEVVYIPSGQYHELRSQVPPHVLPGKHEVTIVGQRLKSLPSIVDISSTDE